MPILVMLHSATMILAFICGSVIILSQKATQKHKILGWIYSFSMILSCLASFGMGKMSFLHVLSLLTIYWIGKALYFVKAKPKGWYIQHISNMASSYIGIWIAGTGVIVRHFIYPGNANKGYIASGISAIIAIPIAKHYVKKFR